MEIRALGEQDIPAWAGLLAAAFDRTQADMVSLLHWLHTGWSWVAYGAWDGDTLAAQYSSLYTSVFVPDCMDVLPMGMSVNMATHPAYRGQGLIKQVAAPVYQHLHDDGIFAGVGFSNAAGVKVDQHSKGYGYQVIGQLQPLMAMSSPFQRPAADFELTDTLPDLSHFKITSQKIHIHVTTEHLAHRFGSHPFRTYQFGVWRTGSAVHGVVIYKPTQLYGVPALSLLAAYSDDLSGLLAAWMSHLPGRMIYTLATPQAVVRDGLSRLAVCMPVRWSRMPYYLTFKPIADSLPSSLLALAHWNCIGGDIL